MSNSATPGAWQAPLSMGFPRQEYWSGLPIPSPRDLSNPGIESGSPALQADSLPTEQHGKPQEYWSGLLFPSPGRLPDPVIKPMSPALAGRFFTAEPQGSFIF